MDYWAMRAQRRLEANEEGAKEALRVLGKAFHRASQDILDDIQRIERRVGSRFGLTPLEVRALLNQPCGREEYLQLLDKIKGMKPGPARDALMARAAAPGYAHRISRLENLQDQVRARTILLSQQYEGLVNETFADTIRKAYARAGFDAQAVIGYASPWSGMNHQAVQRILQAPWSGMTFSRRIWQNQKALTDLLNETITSGFLTGRSTRKTIEEVQQKMAVGYRAAERLVRTETAAMVAMTDKMAYEKARIKRYRYMATLDSITSKICMTLDNEVFDVADMEIGKNCPPMHPHCRSTTTAVIDGVDLSDAQRRSKDPATGMPVRVPRDMSYKEWEGVQEKTYGVKPVLGMKEHKETIKGNVEQRWEHYGIKKPGKGEGSPPAPELVHRTIKTVDRIIKDFPQLNGHLETIEFTAEPGIGSARIDGKVIRLDNEIFSDPGILQAVFDKSVKAGYTVNATDPMFIVAHECGHALEKIAVLQDLGLSGLNTSIEFAAFDQRWQEIGISYFLNAGFTDESTEEIYQKIEAEMGRKALEGPSEMIAQAVAIHYFGEGLHPIADKLVKYLKTLVSGRR